MEQLPCSHRTNGFVRLPPSRLPVPAVPCLPPKRAKRSEATGLLTVARRAFQQTRFYRDLYQAEPTDLSAVPYLSVSDYHRAQGVLDCLVDQQQMIGIIPPFHRNGGRCPFTIPEDEAELILRQRRIVRAMADIGVDLAGRHRFLIVADESRGPFACEISKGFYWEGHQASLCYVNGNADDLYQEIRHHDPDYVVLASGRSLRHGIEMPRSSVILVEHCSGPLIHDCRYPALLYADEVDLIGSRPAGRPTYDHDASQLLIECDPAARLSHLSKLEFSCFPLVRYDLGQRIPLLHNPG
jgi:hypothetical protein